ncbi:MAG: hypothetical protein EHM77_05155, partial [Planctomycetaceae bacterium]
MITSLLKRFVYALFLLGVISIIAFGLSKLVPGDEILDYLSIDDSRYSSSADPLQQRAAYARVAAKRGLDLPLFYVSVIPGYYPDSLYAIVPVDVRETIKKWVTASRDKAAAMQMHRDLLSGLAYACPRANTSEIADQCCQGFSTALNTHDLFSVHHSIIRLHTLNAKSGHTDIVLGDLLNKLHQDIEQLISEPKRLAATAWLPSIYWHGKQNQYHRWMAGFITLQPVTSLIDGRDAW